MGEQFTTYIDFKDDFENGGLFQKEQSLIHRKQMAEICDIIKKRMALERYDPTNHFVSMSDVVSIFARRGAGKTTFVKSLIEIFRHSDKVHGVDCGDLLITDVIEPNQIQRKENFMIRFLAAIHGEFTRLVDRKDIDARDRKPFEDKTRKLYEALPVVDGIGKLSLYSDWDDNEYVAEKFMHLASNVKDLEHRFHEYIYSGLKLVNKKFLLFVLDDCDVNIEKTFEILETIRLFFTSPQIIVVMTGDASLYGMAIRRNYWHFFEQDFLEKECGQAFEDSQRMHEYRKMVNRLETQYLQKMIKPEHRIVLNNVYEKYRRGRDMKQPFRVCVNFTVGIQEELQHVYIDLFTHLGLVTNLNEKASCFVGHLCKQPFRNQYRVLSMYDSWLSIVGERFPDNLTLGDLQMLTDKLMNVFEVYVNQHSRGNKFLTSKTPNYAAWVVKFLLENDILLSGSQMLPVMEEDSMNNALIALSASATRQIQTNSSLVFNFFIRLSFVKQILLTLGEDGQSFEKFVNLFIDSNLTKILGDMHAYVNSKINFAMSLTGDGASNKMFGIVKIPQVLNTEEQGLRRKLVSLIQLTTVAPDNTEMVQFSFYRLFAVLADMLRSYEQISLGSSSEDTMVDFFDFKFNNLAQIHAYWEPNNQKPSSKRHKSVISQKSFLQEEKDYGYIKRLYAWMKHFSAQVSIPTYSLDRIFSRMYFSMKDIEDLDNQSLGDVMSSYVLAFWNSCIIEYALCQKMMHDIDSGHSGEIVSVFIRNFRIFMNQSEIESSFPYLMIACPLFRSYVDTAVLAMMDSDEIKIQDYQVKKESEEVSNMKKRIDDLQSQIDDFDAQIKKLQNDLLKIDKLHNTERDIVRLEDELNLTDVASEESSILAKKITALQKTKRNLIEYLTTDERDLSNRMRRLRMFRMNANARLSELEMNPKLLSAKDNVESIEQAKAMFQKVNEENGHLEHSVYSVLSIVYLPS
mgnify:CR=1 FL=1|jgi:hypothetical protein